MIFRGLSSILIAGVALAVAAPASSFQYSLSVPRIGLTAPLNYKTLDFGPMIYYQDSDTIAIAGHRTTHSHPFLNIDKIKLGDPIFVNTRRFVVKRTLIVKPYEVWILNWRGVVLSACTPKGSAAYRQVVLAKEG